MSSPLYLANSHLKAYSVQTLSEATDFVQDLKLGHYIKIPPRATFLGVFSKYFLGFDFCLCYMATPLLPWLSCIAYSPVDLHHPRFLRSSWSQTMDIR